MSHGTEHNAATIGLAEVSARPAIPKGDVFEPSAPARLRLVFWSIALFVAAIGSVVALAVWSGLALEEIASRLTVAPVWVFGALALLTAVQIMLSAYKWRVVTVVLAPEMARTQGIGFYATCSAISAFLSQFMTVYLSSVVVRSWAMKRFHRVPLGRGAASSVFEQSFDAVVIILMAAPTLLAWWSGRVELWLPAVFVSLACGAGGLVLLPRVLSTLPESLWRLSRVQSVINDGNSANLIKLMSPHRLILLYALSVARYFVILARVPVLMVGIGFTVAPWDAARAFTLVQSTGLLSLTPGNLGIQELSWVGILSVWGYEPAAAADFAIVLRIMTIAAMIAAAGAILMVFSRIARQVS